MVSSRQKGLNFEKRVRTYLEKEGWFVVKFMNNVDLLVPIDISKADPSKGIAGVAMADTPRMIPAKQGRWRLTSTGFPDFFCWRESKLEGWEGLYYPIFVECKSNGYLSVEEKDKCNWYLKRRIVSHIYIASKGKRRGEIVLKEFKPIP